MCIIVLVMAQCQFNLAVVRLGRQVYISHMPYRSNETPVVDILTSTTVSPVIDYDSVLYNHQCTVQRIV